MSSRSQLSDNPRRIPEAVAYMVLEHHAGYLRDSPTYRKQRDAIRRHTYEVGMRFKTVTDNTRAWKKGIGNCPGLAKLLCLARSGTPRVFVTRSQLLAHSEVERALLVDHLRSLGTSVVDATSRLEMAANGIVVSADANNARVLRRARVQLAQLKRRATQLQTKRGGGRPGFGLAPKDQATFKRIRELRRKPRRGKRMSWRQVANSLNEENLQAPAGGIWHDRTIQRIVQRLRPDLAGR